MHQRAFFASGSVCAAQHQFTQRELDQRTVPALHMKLRHVGRCVQIDGALPPHRVDFFLREQAVRPALTGCSPSSYRGTKSALRIADEKQPDSRCDRRRIALGDAELHVGARASVGRRRAQVGHVK